MAPASGIVSYLSVSDRPPISKRAARRLIQQAVVLTARDRPLRRQIREVRLTTLWVLEDWNFEWTVILNRGKLRFDRRPAHAPDLTLTWRSAEEFFTKMQDGRAPDESLEIDGDLALRQYVDPVYRSFCRSLEQVIKYPFDDAENPLM